ncbi:hypothetical protein [Streptomyces palmae]|uniref:Uncharacterized protein n=1 Tax=Streptomyces palmae TaxID=1701085 RepID=A0A4Z0GEG4_9ACTN|nr:hypothetical protein [Streptomyces palmae]TGA93817.1 hypothetical protein E4099_26365 [Streptomyces palmae]
MTTSQPQGLTRYDRRMIAIMNNRAGRQLYATRGRRRAIVAVHVALTAGMVAVVAGGPRLIGGRWQMLAAVAVLLPLWCVAMGMINGATRGLLELRDHALDERQLAERDRVFRRAHRVVTAALLAALIGMEIGGWSEAPWLEVPLRDALMVVLAMHWLMPAWAAGLMVQDEPADDLDADELEAGALAS